MYIGITFLMYESFNQGTRQLKKVKIILFIVHVKYVIPERKLICRLSLVNIVNECLWAGLKDFNDKCAVKMNYSEM